MRTAKVGQLPVVLLRDNPFFLRRVRSYLRGNRFYLLLLGYVLLVCVVLGWYQLDMAGTISLVGYSEIALLGRRLFLGVTITQAVVICLVTPLLTAAVVAVEKEKQTFDLLKLTTRSPASLIAGEILAAMAFILLLLLAALPIVGLVFLFGGVSPGEFLVLYLALLLTGGILSALGVFISVTHDKVSKAVTSAVGALVLLTLVLPALSFHPPTRLLGCFNPLLLIGDIQDRGSFDPSFFSGEIPLVLAVVVLTPLAALLLATLAARKVYDPGGRALSGWQMAAVFYAVLFLLIAGAWQSPGQGYLNCLLALFFLLLVLMMNQSVHPGSREAEQLRRRGVQRPDALPWLWLHLVLGNVAIAAWVMWRGVDLDSPTVGLSALVVAMPLTAYWALVRLMGLLSRDRSAMIRNAFLLVVFLLALPPLVGVIGRGVLENQVSWPEQAPHLLVWTTLINTSPIVALLELQSRLGYLMSPGSWDDFRTPCDPWLICCAFHGLLFLLFKVLADLLCSRRAAKRRAVPGEESLAREHAVMS